MADEPTEPPALADYSRRTTVGIVIPRWLASSLIPALIIALVGFGYRLDGQLRDLRGEHNHLERTFYETKSDCIGRAGKNRDIISQLSETLHKHVQRGEGFIGRWDTEIKDLKACCERNDNLQRRRQ